MHELSIALSILDFVHEEAERRGCAAIVAVHVKLGPLSGVVSQALQSAYELARDNSGFDHCALIIEDVPLVVFCPACNAEGPPESIQQLCCKKCGTPTPEVRTGRELEVVGMEIYQ